MLFDIKEFIQFSVEKEEKKESFKTSKVNTKAQARFHD
jgi:hypothetical protein